MRTFVLVILIVTLIFGGVALVVSWAGPGQEVDGAQPPPATAATPTMPGMGSPASRATPMPGMPMAPMVPPVTGFYGGEQILFIHTEASDPEVADVLTRMMDSPVLVVPSLARVPEEALANVFVFTNGVPGDGPMGFQPDVFDAAPGDPDYSPLRALNLVTWQDGAAIRELRSSEEVTAAARNGEITIDRPGVVVNMPFLTWPDGQR